MRSALFILALPAFLALPAQAKEEVLLQQTLAVALQGNEVGTIEALDKKNADGVTLSRVTKLKVKRGATSNDMVTKTVVKLKPDMSPVSYRYERSDKSGTLVTEGKIVGGNLEIKTTQNGATVSNKVPVPAGTTFALGLEHETRTHLKDGLNMQRTVIIEEMAAPVPMTVTVKKKGDGFAISSTFANLTTDEDVDAKGATIVARTPAVGITAYPIGRAPADLGKGTSDLLALSTWTTKPVLPPTSRVVYRVTAPDANSFVIPEDARQKILKKTAKTIDVEVRSGDTFSGALDGARLKTLTSATPYEAIADPRIVKTAADVTKGAKDKREEVARLMKFVFNHVEQKGLDRGYAPAVATLESRAGDCTEHSVLLSALARARGIPTRLVDGVVVDGTKAGYHEWVEVYLDGKFVPVDPTFGVFPAGPERLKLAEGSTEPTEHLQLSLAAARLLKPGVKIEVLDVTPAK